MITHVERREQLFIVDQCTFVALRCVINNMREPNEKKRDTEQESKEREREETEKNKFCLSFCTSTSMREKEMRKGEPERESCVS